MKQSTALGLVLLGAMVYARAQDAPPPADNDTSPLHVALVNYKSGNYDKARTAIDEAEKANPGDPATELLKARILTEQHDYMGGEKILRGMLTPDGPLEVELALGDLYLRKGSYDRAGKLYSTALQAKPKDPDIILKMVYAKVGGGDMVAAGQYTSQLSPLDPKNPYDDHASYYFAKAAIAQATGNPQGADDEIQDARTNYGITVTNRYLKTYLEVFATHNKGASSDATLAPKSNSVPTGAK